MKRRGLILPLDIRLIRLVSSRVRFTLSSSSIAYSVLRTLQLKVLFKDPLWV